MNYNKVVYSGKTLIDLTNDTVDESKLLSGEIAHDKSGNIIIGELEVNDVYSGTSEPSSSLGNNGDIYIKL